MTTPGKSICKELKTVRRRIAEENGIELEMPECTYKGPCRGTCPRCESELRYLESALADRLRMGKAATVAGIALALTGTAAAQSTGTPPLPPAASECCRPDTGAPRLEAPVMGKPATDAAELVHNPPQVVADSVRATGTVVDRDTKEPLPFVNVVVKKDGKQVAVAVTDFDGIFTINLPEDTYDLEFTYLGYQRSIWPHVIFPQDMWNRKEPMVMVVGDVQQLDSVLIEGDVGRYIEIGPDSQFGSEIQGVMLRVQY